MTRMHSYNVQPIKDSVVLKQVQDTLLTRFKAGRRNYTIFQLGKATLLRVSDVLSLRYHDVYDENGVPKERVYTVDQKTGKKNCLYLKPIREDLIMYQEWLTEQNIQSNWLFPSLNDSSVSISRKQYYKVMFKTGKILNINYLGTHTMRKTGAYRVYEQTNYNIGFVMSLLNHSDQKSTLSYLGLDEVTKETLLDTIRFD